MSRLLSPEPGVDLRHFQRCIEETFGDRDRARGLEATFLWFVEEVGELSRALRTGHAQNLRVELSDVLAWLTTLSSMAGIDLSDAAGRYRNGCPRCGARPCTCPPRVGPRDPT